MDAVAALLAEKGADRSDIRFPVLEGRLPRARSPPGTRPSCSRPGIISSIWGLHSTAVFSPDGNEVYWAPMMTFPGEVYSRGGLLMMKRVKGRWTPPAWASFSGPKGEDDVPFFSSDGKRLYFISAPAASRGNASRGARRSGSRTGPPPAGPSPRLWTPTSIPSNKHWEFSLDRKGNLYFAGRPPDSRGLSDHLPGPVRRRQVRKAGQPGRPLQHRRDRGHAVHRPGRKLPPVPAPVRSLGELPRTGRRLERPGQPGT